MDESQNTPCSANPLVTPGYVDDRANCWLDENAALYRGNNASDCMIEAYKAGANAIITMCNESIAADKRDAYRWRKFTSILQSVYDGETFESDMLDVYCRMQSDWENRTVQAELRWDDKRDEPLDLGSAVDAA